MNIELLVRECNKLLSALHRVSGESSVSRTLHGHIRSLFSCKKCLNIFGNMCSSEASTFAFAKRLRPCFELERVNGHWCVKSFNLASDHYDSHGYLELCNRLLASFDYKKLYHSKVDELISFKDLEKFKF